MLPSNIAILAAVAILGGTLFWTTTYKTNVKMLVIVQTALTVISIILFLLFGAPLKLNYPEIIIPIFLLIILYLKALKNPLCEPGIIVMGQCGFAVGLLVLFAYMIPFAENNLFDNFDLGSGDWWGTLGIFAAMFYFGFVIPVWFALHFLLRDKLE